MYIGRMTKLSGVCLLILAFISKSLSGTLGRALDTEDNQKGYYPNNPFLNYSFPGELYRHAYYPGHHHHHNHDFYHNHGHDHHTNNPDDYVPEADSNTDFMESSFPSVFSDSPKVTIRRETTDEDIPDYPYDEIRKYLEKNPLLKQYFTKLPTIGNRDGAPDDVEEGETLCKMQTIRTFFPKTLKNINNVDRVIINDDREYKQAIEQTRCANNGQCTIPFDTFGYTSYCHQNFDNKKLMVFDNSTKNIVFDEFKVPSCCVCKIKKV